MCFPNCKNKSTVSFNTDGTMSINVGIVKAVYRFLDRSGTPDYNFTIDQINKILSKRSEFIKEDNLYEYEIRDILNQFIEEDIMVNFLKD